MLETTRSKSKSGTHAPSKKVTMKTLLKEADILFFYRFVHRYGIREKALEVLNAKLRQARAN